MKLRQKSKRDQALDAVASIAKTWSEWRLGEKVSQTASKGAKKASKSASKAAKKAAKSGSSGGGRKRRPLKIAGMIALLGGIGAAAAKKLTGGKAEPLYTPPAPSPETAPSPAVAEGLTQPPAVNVPVAPSPQPAGSAPAEATPTGPGPVGVEDIAADVAAAAGASESREAQEAGVVPGPQEASPSQELAPEPENLISDPAPEGGSEDDDAAAVDETTERP